MTTIHQAVQARVCEVNPAGHAQFLEQFLLNMPLRDAGSGTAYELVNLLAALMVIGCAPHMPRTIDDAHATTVDELGNKHHVVGVSDGVRVLESTG